MGTPRSLTIPGRYSEIRQACRFIADAARDAGFTRRIIFHLELACDEACTNVIEHAYGDEDMGEITLSYQVDGDEFIVTIADYGRSFDPDTVPPPPHAAVNASRDPEELKVGGLGLHLMRQTMDEISFTFDEVQGNRLTMIKRLPGADKK